MLRVLKEGNRLAIDDRNRNRCVRHSLSRVLDRVFETFSSSLQNLPLDLPLNLGTVTGVRDNLYLVLDQAMQDLSEVRQKCQMILAVGYWEDGEEDRGNPIHRNCHAP